MKQQKTNAMRLLEKLDIPYQAHGYATDDGAVDGLSVAKKTGRDPARVYKTLCAKGASGGVLVFCIPVDRELDLKAAARAAGEKSVAMLPLAGVNAATGYVRGGVSPLAMKKAYPTWIDEAAGAMPTILVSGGRVGLQIELAPAGLARAAGAAFAPLAQ